MDFNAAEFFDHLADLDLDESEKRALIEALWRIAQVFVDDAFGGEPITDVHSGDNSGASQQSNVIQFRVAANDNDEKTATPRKCKGTA